MAHQDIIMVIHYENCKNKWSQTLNRVHRHIQLTDQYDRRHSLSKRHVIQYEMCGNVCGDSPLGIECVISLLYVSRQN